MSGVRPPVVAGIGGGAGTTTLATALRGHDTGRAAVATGDILACRGTFDSLRRAGVALERAVGPGPPPVLAVTLGGTRIPRGALQARLELLTDATSGVVVLPYVGHWATTVDPLQEAAGLLLDASPPPRALRAYAAALRELAAVVTASGRLRTEASPPPLPRRPPRRADAATPVVPSLPMTHPGRHAASNRSPAGEPVRVTAGAPTPAAGIRVGVPPRVVDPRADAPPRPEAGDARATSRPPATDERTTGSRPSGTAAPAGPRGVRIVTAAPRRPDGRQVG